MCTCVEIRGQLLEFISLLPPCFEAVSLLFPLLYIFQAREPTSFQGQLSCLTSHPIIAQHPGLFVGEGVSKIELRLPDLHGKHFYPVRSRHALLISILQMRKLSLRDVSQWPNALQQHGCYGDKIQFVILLFLCHPELFSLQNLNDWGGA